MLTRALTLFTLLALMAHLHPLSAAAPQPIKVVVVAMFEVGADTGDTPGELQQWVEWWPLPKTLAFPAGARALRQSADDQVLAVVTGIGTANAAATITALGFDPRFDLTQSYFLIAGISGIDPADGTVGDAVWADWVVDGDLARHVDAREKPDDWTTGYIPFRGERPYQQPRPQAVSTQVFRLNPELTDWAYQLTKDMDLTDTPEMQQLRALFKGEPAAQRAPKVFRGDQLAAMTYWHGRQSTRWANDWVDYWTEGRGNFVTSAMEDSGTLEALARLDAAGRVNKDRVLVLRTASNFTAQYPGIDAANSVARTGLAPEIASSGFVPATDAAYRVGSTVVKALMAR